MSRSSLAPESNDTDLGFYNPLSGISSSTICTFFQPFQYLYCWTRFVVYAMYFNSNDKH